MILYTVVAMISVYLYKIIETVSVSVLVYSYKYRNQLSRTGYSSGGVVLTIPFCNLHHSHAVLCSPLYSALPTNNLEGFVE